MATFNIETTIASGSYHKRSTGMTGQVLASPQIEAKLARVEALYREVYGVGMGRYKLYNLVLEIAREGKADVGGYLQYMAQDAAGIVLGVSTRNLASRFAARSSVTCSLTLVALRCIICVTLPRERGGRQRRRLHNVAGKSVSKSARRVGR